MEELEREEISAHLERTAGTANQPGNWMGYRRKAFRNQSPARGEIETSILRLIVEEKNSIGFGNVSTV